MRKFKVSIFLLSSVLFTTMANAQTAPQRRQLQQQPVPQKVHSSTGNDCAKGAGNALEATAIVTVLGCAVDFFFTGGTLCTVYVSTAVANAPTAAVTGCAIGAMGSTAAGASAGISAAPHIQLDQ